MNSRLQCSSARIDALVTVLCKPELVGSNQAFTFLTCGGNEYLVEVLQLTCSAVCTGIQETCPYTSMSHYME